MNTSICLTSTWTVLLLAGNFIAFIAPQLYLLKEILLVKTENVYAIGTRPVYVICDPAHLLKAAFGGTGVKTVLVFS